MRNPLSLRVAATLLWIDAVGFGLPCIMAIRHFLSGRGILYIMGFPTYGKGPFERYGLQTTVPLLVGFLSVCTLEGLAGWLVWRGRKSGAILSLVLLPAGAVYWWGFALPIPPIFAIARTPLILLSWSRLK
ncbi:MAG TPA: hypothetical protein VND68_05665 [Chloroflexia bacterium]|jgi:hypothetical protein|nr:hypothetical protein [Chloroflexia bacterium]